MKLLEDIKNNPYLKVSNCTDVADCEAGLRDVRFLQNYYPGSKTLDKIRVNLEYKKMKLNGEL